MFKQFACILFCCFTCAATALEKKDLAVAAIPSSLIANANAVIRFSETEMEIVGPEKVQMTQTGAVTILNMHGDKYADIKIFYGSFSEVDDVDCSLLDASGKEIRKMHRKDLLDLSAGTANFVDDDRARFFSFNYKNYPYTIFYKIRETHYNSLFLPAWIPQLGFDCAVEDAKVSVRYPFGFVIRSKADNRIPTGIKDVSGSSGSLIYSLNHLAVSDPPDEFSSPDLQQLPNVIFAADDFSIGGKQGNMRSWANFGKFIYGLNKDVDDLSDDFRQEIHRICDTCSTVSSKVSILYSYLEKNTRYVSIQQGLGGWRAAKSSAVASKKYGDCKGLTYFMKSMLSEVGVPAYAAYVSAGRSAFRKVDPDFPCSMFNHVILCVPAGNDSIWLECTAHDFPAGYLSSFTSGREVLLVSDQGGTIVQTPDYDERQNQTAANADVYFNADLNFTGHVTATFTGMHWDKISEVASLEKSDLDRFLANQFRLGTYRFSGTTFHHSNSSLPSITEAMEVSGNGKANFSGSRIILVPTVFETTASDPPQSHLGRFTLRRGFTFNDTVNYHFPFSITCEAGCEDVLQSSSSAKYKFTVTLTDDHSVRVTRQYIQHKGEFESGSYPEFRQICHEANSQRKLVLMKKG
jgi:Domain of Unknown Function with PDB structure (DUF3857)